MDRGQNFIQKMAPGLKLGILFGFSIALFFIRDFRISLPMLIVVMVLFRIAGYTWKKPFKQLARLWWFLILLLLIQYFSVDWQSALNNVIKIIAMILFASLVTMTTPMSRMLATLEWFFALIPLPGLNPARLSLAIALTIRFVPVMSHMASQVREAQKARGLESHYLAILVPLLIRMVKMSDDIADAIEARCYDNSGRGIREQK